MARHRVVVIGEINPEKVVKKIKNKTGKRVEILSCKEDKEEEVSDEENQYFQPQEKIIKGSEVSALLGRMPSAVGYQPTLSTEMSSLQERITSTKEGSIISIQTVYVPADNFFD
ncbi:hypothetical protein M9H77_36666 [Catharanthus roseus]|uniref:Uncharacterized protein n=1 Tax=Catharanthus roseus TaxID=4058 RepID=A0ACB9ZSF2_CATRO|nr:hypothetical protein M9H77_36666 [Catharanthus roseus]